MDDSYTMENQEAQAAPEAQEVYTAPEAATSKPIHVPSLVLMIIGALFALLLPIVTYPCSIVSLVLSVMKKNTHKTTYAIVINIIVFVLALGNSVLGVILYLGMMS